MVSMGVAGPGGRRIDLRNLSVLQPCGDDARRLSKAGHLLQPGGGDVCLSESPGRFSRDRAWAFSGAAGVPARFFVVGAATGAAQNRVGLRRAHTPRWIDRDAFARRLDGNGGGGLVGYFFGGGGIGYALV